MMGKKDGDFDIVLPTVQNGKIVQPQTAPVKTAPAKGDFNIVYPSFNNGHLAAQLTPRASIRAQAMDNEAVDQARLRGLTFGLSDRIEALLKPGKYEDNLKQIQADRDAYANAHPYANLGNELLGGIASGGAEYKLARAAGSKLLPSVAEFLAKPGAAPQAAKGGLNLLENAAIGEGVAQSQKAPGHVGDDLGQGAAWGAGLGTLSHVAGGVLKHAIVPPVANIANKIATATHMITPAKIAEGKFVDSLADAKLKPEDIMDELKFLRGDDLQLQGPNGQDPKQVLPDLRSPVIVADAVPKRTQNLIAKGVRRSDDATANVQDAMAIRNEDQLNRLKQLIQTTISPDTQTQAYRDAIIAARKAKADPHYQAAFAVGTPDDPSVPNWITDSDVNLNLFKDLDKNLKTNASRNGLTDQRPMDAELNYDEDGNPYFVKKPSIRDLDTIKKHIDNKISGMWDPAKNEFRPPRSDADPTAQQWMKTREALINTIDQLTPDGNGGSHYANARKAYADDTELLQAHQDAQNIMRNSPEMVARQYDKYSGRPELQQAYQSGVAAALDNAVQSAKSSGSSTILNRMWGAPKTQAKISYVLGNNLEGQQFNRSMATEKNMFATGNKITPSAPTGINLVGDSEGFQVPVGLANLAMGRLGAAAANLGRVGMGALDGVTAQVGDELSKIALMSPEQYAAWVAARNARQQTLGAKAGRAVGALGQYLANGVRPAVSAGGGFTAADKGLQSDANQYLPFLVSQDDANAPSLGTGGDNLGQPPSQ